MSQPNTVKPPLYNAYTGGGALLSYQMSLIEIEKLCITFLLPYSEVIAF